MLGSIALAFLTFLLTYNDIEDFVSFYIWGFVFVILACVIIVLIILVRGLFGKEEIEDIDGDT